jgi:hypothetical protein
MGWGMRAIVIVLAIALILVVLSPHVAVLKPIAQRLGLVQTQTIYVPINHTVVKYVNQTVVRYINQTVPVYVYVNRTVYVPVGSNISYFESYAGYCSGRLVILPNNTAWIVWFWLAPKAYFESSPTIYWYYFQYTPPIYYNSTTHYAQFVPPIMGAEFLTPQGLALAYTPTCYVDNVTINNYYALVCGDTGGGGPTSFIGYSFVRNSTGMWEVFISLNVPPVVGNFAVNATGYYYLPIPVRNATYTGIMMMQYEIGEERINVLGPTCDLTITFVSNATAALWLPVTTNQTLINYWRYAGDLTFGYPLGYHNPYDNTMGYWVWNYPS